DQLPQRLVELALFEPELRLELVRKERAALLEQRQQHPRAIADRLRRSTRSFEKPFQIVPADQRDRRTPPRRHAARRVVGARQPSPRDLAGETKLIEKRTIVPSHAGRQNVAFPRTRRRLKTLQLREHLGQTLRPVQLRSRRDVLPAEEETDEILRRGRLDFAPQPPERQAMDARQQRPFAPFGLGRALAVAALQDEALVLQLRQLVIDG